MKLIKYQIVNEVNHGTEEEPNIVQTFYDVERKCSADCFDASYSAAEKEAYGEITVEDIPDPVVEPTTDDILNAMLGVE